ncbi:retrovirus-related pol polyprotein from transposon RE1 [Citrus sinensis]|uniref:Retrovirus-related pol polyprotein from transposon RE1 n=1 Tax=Citrus sinensis TaxID=2711 RepID=A0ACB8KBL9_CITSI|nr:retrovirus-related pol polyprotein from transposon RE1 [Citrus sinensis]
MALAHSNQNTATSISSFSFTSPIKLDRSNYTIWKSQILSSVRANGIEDLLDSSKCCPDQVLPHDSENSTAETQINLAFTAWKRKDQMLLSWLMSSINLEILSLVVNSETSLDLWISLEQQFGSETFAKKVHLKMMLNNLKKGSMSMTDFFGKLKTITDELAIAGNPISSLDFITHLISGLGQPYYPVVSSVNKEAKLNYAANFAQTGSNNKSSNQFNNNWNKNAGNNNGGRGGYGRGYTQGQGRGNWNNNWNGNGMQTGNYQGRGPFQTGNYQGRGYAGNGGYAGGNSNGNFARNGGGFNNGKNVIDPNTTTVTCQICFKPRHTAAECRNRFNREFVPFYPTFGYNPAQFQAPRAAFLTTSEGEMADQGWYIDSGATHHLTNNLQNLNLGKEYSGNQLLHVGNGQGLHISHIGYTSLSTSCGSSLHLHDILYVPQLTKNLISISKLLENNNLIIEFVANMCFIKDKKREVHLAQGIARGGLYQLLSKNDFVSNSCNLTYGPSSMLSIFDSSTCNHSDSAENKTCIPQCHTNTVKSIMSANLFHQRFGHPNKHVLKCILSTLSLNCPVTMPDFCDACQYGKMHQLPFYSTGIKTKAPLELIHTDLWGPAPLSSSTGYRYYISFVDDYSRYCWIFPLTLKSEALDTFKFFKNLVEKQIGCSVKALQSDWGGEYRSFQQFLAQEGVVFRHSCPHTHHQNGVVERKHRHIVETGLTLLAQATIPLSFWWESFHTASFLINRMPTSILNNLSPFTKLYGRKPDYHFLRTFGCSCYPFLRPYSQHKFNFHIQKCVMIGYSPIHKGYKCLASSGKVYIARHVTFNESEFPYSELFPSHKPNHNIQMSQFLSTNISLPAVIEDISSIQSSLSSPTPGAAPNSGNSETQSMQQSPNTSSQSSSSQPLSTNHSSQPHTQPQTQPSLTPGIQNTHSMVTRSKAGVFKPKTYLAAVQELEPHSVKAALADSKWRQAMQDEYEALQKNETWVLVPKESAGKIVGNKWVFRVKYNPDGSISKYKARLVAKGFHQTQGVDFFETFSPVVKQCTIRVILSLAVMHNWTVRQLDVNNAFLHGILTENVFMHQPEGFVHPQFPSHDLGEFNYFLGLEVTPSVEGLHLSQTKYIGDLLKKAQMLDCKGCQTPMSSTEKLVKDKGAMFENPSLYRSLVGSLQYVTLTRPEIAFTVNKLSQFLACPSVFHWQACKRVLRYLQSTAHYGLQFYNSGSLYLTAFSDADWGSDLDDRRSVGGYCVYLGSNLISWSSKKQHIVSRSTAESEYRALALAAAEVLWITYLLKELKVSLQLTPVLQCDNKSAEALASNPKYHSRTKHIELDLHFIREHIAKKELQVSHVPSYEQAADILTKPLAYDQFNYLRSKLNVLPRP